MIFLLPWSSSVSSPRSAQCHLLTLKTLQWLLISKSKAKPFQKATSSCSHSWLSDLPAHNTLSLIQLQPQWPPGCSSCQAFALWLTVCRTSLPRYPHYLLSHFGPFSKVTLWKRPSWLCAAPSSLFSSPWFSSIAPITTGSSTGLSVLPYKKKRSMRAGLCSVP